MKVANINKNKTKQVKIKRIMNNNLKIAAVPVEIKFLNLSQLYK